MAFASTSHSTDAGLTTRFIALLSSAFAALARHRLYNRTFNELSALSNRELDDLGLSRAHLRSVAYGVAHNH
ncbi:MAG: DUF1127 domain-containing protein [Halocynthiibacter sp.]